MKWLPWSEAKGTPPPATNQGEPITEPPCRLCRHFYPQVTFINGEEGLTPDGVRLCHARTMHHDFSCFSEKR